MSWDAPTGQMPRPDPRPNPMPRPAPLAPVLLAPVLLASVSRDPTDEELVAIVAAMEALWPRPAAAPWNGTETDESSAWRFSGRWWARPLPARRARPWR